MLNASRTAVTLFIPASLWLGHDLPAAVEENIIITLRSYCVPSLSFLAMCVHAGAAAPLPLSYQHQFWVGALLLGLFFFSNKNL